MTHQSRRFIQTFILAALFALVLPVAASAQGNYDPYGRDRDYRRDRNHHDRRDRNRDYGRNGNNRYGYDQRQLRDSVRRLKDRSNDFKKHIDSALDHSRYDGRRREDRINEEARDFQNAADRLKDRYNNGRNINNSTEDARRLVQLGSRIDRFIARNPLDSRTTSDWSAIRQDLRVIANAYGFRMSDFDGVYNRPNDNRGYRRRSSYPNNGNNTPWYRQLSF